MANIDRLIELARWHGEMADTNTALWWDYKKKAGDRIRDISPKLMHNEDARKLQYTLEYSTRIAEQKFLRSIKKHRRKADRLYHKIIKKGGGFNADFSTAA